MKKLIIVIEILLIIWIGTLVANRYLAYFQIKPILTYKTVEHPYDGGTALEYVAVGYKVVNYQNEKVHDYKVLPFWKEIDYKIVNK